MQLKHLVTESDIAEAFETFLELRPFLSDRLSFINQIVEQQKQGYKIIGAVEDETILACIGFRMTTMLAWGKILYIDDLITKEIYRNRGYGKILLQHAIKVANDEGCNQVHLDTGYHRHSAHKTYLNMGFKFTSHHLSLVLE